MARPKDDTWVVKLDEFHPDPPVAATYADQGARLAARRHYSERIKALVNRTAALTYEEDAELKAARSNLKRVEEALAELADQQQKEQG